MSEFGAAQESIERVVGFVESKLAAGYPYDEAVYVASIRFLISEINVEMIYDDYGGVNKHGNSGETTFGGGSRYAN